MASAKFSIGAVDITGYLRVIGREVTDPTSEVANVVYAPPQPTTRNIQIDDLNPVMHYFDFYESVDGIALGTLLATFSIDVGKLLAASFTLYEFVVDRGEENDPVSNTKTYTNTALESIPESQQQWSQRGIGPRSWTDEIEKIDEGGFKFPDASTEVFLAEDRWFGIVGNITTIQDPVIIGKALYKDIIEITANTTIDSTHYNCLLEANGSSSNIIMLTFPALDTIPNNTIFGITTQFGLQRYVAVQLDSGDTCRLMGEGKNIFWLGKAETIMMMLNDTKLKVASYDGDYKRVGEKVKSDLIPINGFAETGGWFDITDYPRFYYEFVNKIPLGQLSEVLAGVVIEKTKFAKTVTQFWMPDTGGYFERNVDPNGDIDARRIAGQRYTGTSQLDMDGPHNHPADENDATVFYIKRKEGGPGGGFGVNPSGDGFELKASNTGENTGTETTPKNIAVNCWRII